MFEFLVDVVAAFRLFGGRTVGFGEDKEGCDAEEEGFCEGVGAVFDGSVFLGVVRVVREEGGRTYLVSDKGRML